MARVVEAMHTTGQVILMVVHTWEKLQAFLVECSFPSLVLKLVMSVSCWLGSNTYQAPLSYPSIGILMLWPSSVRIYGNIDIFAKGQT